MTRKYVAEIVEATHRMHARKRACRPSTGIVASQSLASTLTVLAKQRVEHQEVVERQHNVDVDRVRDNLCQKKKNAETKSVNKVLACRFVGRHVDRRIERLCVRRGVSASAEATALSPLTSAAPPTNEPSNDTSNAADWRRAERE